MFKIRKEGDGHDAPLKIDILNTDSKFFCYLINTSRLYWQEEVEKRFGEDHESADAYIKAYPFCIDGEGLTLEQINEQKQNLISKIFTFGYMLHRYKDAVRAWAPLAMDNKIGEEGECNGRSGKSFFFKVLSFMMKTVKLSGRNPKLMDNPHVFDPVTQYTDMILIDDCDQYLNLGPFYDNITSDMNVNPKNNRMFTIPFNESPKMAFTTNYVPKISTRLLRHAHYTWCSQTGITSAMKRTGIARLERFETTLAKHYMPMITARRSGTTTLISGCSAAASISQ